MTTLPIDTKTMYPWHDINRMMSNAKSLTVRAGSQTYQGAATLENQDGHLTLVFKAKKAK